MEEREIIAALRADLKTYRAIAGELGKWAKQAGHHRKCDVFGVVEGMDAPPPCSCGLHSTLARYNEIEEGKR